jgi:iron complex outermembrane receptor protein
VKPIQKTLAAALAVSLYPFSGGVAVAAEALSEDESGMEIVVVTGVRRQHEVVLQTQQVSYSGPDNSDLLRLFPGGNRNSNGPLTRISQYRGLFGAQNQVAIDGFGYSPDCPNWMDSPLSSIPQSMTESVTLYRGIGSVDAVEEGLGGAIRIESRSGEFSDSKEWSSYGSAEANYGSNASSWGAALFAGVNNAHHWLDLSASKDKGGNYEFDGGVVADSQYDREQYRLGYGHRFNEAEISFGAVINRTGETGTPALPMDIRFIDSEQYSFELETPAGPGQLAFRLSTLSVDHVMDNFTSRPPPLKMGKPNYRQSAPYGDTHTASLVYEIGTEAYDLILGLDGKRDTHTAKITNPYNDLFYILNFNDVKRERTGAFAVLTWPAGRWDLEADLRYNRVDMDAGEVGGFLGMMSPQQQRLDELAATFNAADRNVSDNQWVGAVKASTALTDSLRLNAGLGRKMRSPSYQERYLWVPLEATSGLADGRTYIGDITLKPEKSIELTAGVDWTAGSFRLTPEVFYRDISDYIQGVPSTNMTANLFGMMMTGKPPLQFANVDAEMYGFDMGYEWQFAATWSLRGNLGYVRGKRTDVKDNLYRIPPLSSFLELRYQHERYFIAAESVAAAKQDKVSAYNQEQPSAGWGIINLRAGIELGRRFSLGLGVENLADKLYQDHLGGYNRVRDSDVPVGVRLYSQGRNFYLRLSTSW